MTIIRCETKWFQLEVTDGDNFSCSEQLELRNQTGAFKFIVWMSFEYLQAKILPPL